MEADPRRGLEEKSRFLYKDNLPLPGYKGVAFEELMREYKNRLFLFLHDQRRSSFLCALAAAA